MQHAQQLLVAQKEAETAQKTTLLEGVSITAATAHYIREKKGTNFKRVKSFLDLVEMLHV